MSELLNTWLVYYDPIHRGWTRQGIACGVCTRVGYGFGLVRGGYLLFRGVGSPEAIDRSAPVGAAGSAAATVTNFVWRRHAAATVYYYAVAAVGGGGVVGEAAYPAVRVEFDGSGLVVPGRPNHPAGLSAAAASGGRFVLTWRYDAAEQAAEPVRFEVFHDNGTGTINYGSPAAQIAYVRRQYLYSWVSDAFGDGLVIRWAVRAVAADGTDDGNVEVVAARADAAGPVGVPAVTAEPGAEVGYP